MPRIFPALFLAIIFLAGCQTTAPQRDQQSAKHINAHSKDYKKCRANFLKKYAGSRMLETFGIQNFKDKPATQAQLSNNNYITDEQIAWYTDFSVKQLECVKNFTNYVGTTARKHSDAFRTIFFDRKEYTAKLFTREITIGEYVQYRKDHFDKYNAELARIYNEAVEGIPSRLKFKTTNTLEKMRQPIMQFQAAPDDLYIQFHHLGERNSPLYAFTFGQNAPYLNDNSSAISQLLIKKSGKDFVFRLALLADENLLKIIDALPYEMNFYRVGTNLRSNVNKNISYLNLGFVNLQSMERVRIDKGMVLDSGWVYAPSSRTDKNLNLHKTRFTKGSHEDLRKNFELNYKYFADFDNHLERYPLNIGPYLNKFSCNAGFCTNSHGGDFLNKGYYAAINLTWYRGKRLDRQLLAAPEFGHGLTVREHIETQLYGDLALSAQENSDDIYKELFSEYLLNIEKRKEIKSWLKRNIGPVSPYEIAHSKCGSMPSLRTKNLNRVLNCLFLMCKRQIERVSAI